MKDLPICILAWAILCISPTFAGTGSVLSDAKDRPDLIFINGNILTMDDARPRAEAVAVRDGLIAAVGKSKEIESLGGPGARRIDLEGKTMIPGFIEGHAHLLYLGRSLQELKLADASTWDDVVAMVAEASAKSPPGEWIVGSGWHQEKWRKAPEPSLEGYPTHEKLSRASPENPVLLYHASGHAAVANAVAMRMAGIDSDYAAPAGGRVLLDEKGDPTGILLDTAIDPVERAAEQSIRDGNGQETEERMRKTVELAVDHALSNGITSFQDAGSSFETVDLLKRMAQDDLLRMRLWVMLREPNESLEKRLSEYRIEGADGGRLTVRAVKRFMDGALGSRTAWLLEPYADAPDQTGLNVESPQYVEETARIALQNGFQLCVHAIGDRANREILDVFQRVFEGEGRALPTDLRWRIEHAQHLHPDDAPRFARLGVVASMQPVHCTSDGSWTTSRIGRKRAEAGAYVWRKLLDSGAVVAAGTDAPVEDVDPIANFHAAVTRRLPDGSLFFPDQAMAREQALKAYTIENAYAAFEDHLKGSVTPGKYADFTVLSQDLTTVPEEKILETRILYAIVGGKIEYDASDG